MILYAQNVTNEFESSVNIQFISSLISHLKNLDLLIVHATRGFINNHNLSHTARD